MALLGAGSPASPGTDRGLGETPRAARRRRTPTSTIGVPTTSCWSTNSRFARLEPSEIGPPLIIWKQAELDRVGIVKQDLLDALARFAPAGAVEVSWTA